MYHGHLMDATHQNFNCTIIILFLEERNILSVIYNSNDKQDDAHIYLIIVR